MTVPYAKLKRRASLDGFQFDRAEVLMPSAVLARKINWRDYVKDDMYIHEEDAQLLEDIQGAPEADQKALLEDRGVQYAKAFEKAIGKITVEETLQYLLTLLSQLLDVKDSFVQQFIAVHGSFNVIYSLLHRSNYSQYTIDYAAKILAVMFANDSHPAQNPGFKDYLNWMFNILMTPSSETPVVLGVIAALKDFLRSGEIQQVFVEERGLRTLTSILSSSKAQSVQLCYNVGFCVWQLSFHSFAYDAILQSDILESIVNVLRNGPREKVARVFVRALKNICNKDSFNEIMLNLGTLKVLQSIAAEKTFTDDDLRDDVESIIKILQHDLETLSTFEIYQKEINAGKLHWSQVHTEKFWKENVNKMDENDFSLIKALVRLLESESIETVAIACYDLGEFARFYPGGKKIITRLKGKEKLLLQMSNPAPEIQRQALIAVQKLMVQNWANLSK